MPEPGVGNAPERDGFGPGGDPGGAGGDRDRVIADRFRETFEGGFMTDDPFGPGGAFTRDGRSVPPSFNARKMMVNPLGYGVRSMLQHMFTRNPDGSLGFTPPGGSAAAAEGRAGERGDPRGIGQGRLRMADTLEQLLNRGREQANPEAERQARIDAFMAQLQQLLSPPSA